MVKKKDLAFLVSLVILSLVACAPLVEAYPAAEQDAFSGSISITGSTTVQPLAESLADSFMAANRQIEVTVQGGGSSVGIKSAGEGTTDIGTASLDIKATEFNQYPELVVLVIARDGIAIVVNKDVPVIGLTIDQVRAIFSGEITNWNAVGGPDQYIFAISREEGSGTRDAFEKLVMGEDALISERLIFQPSNGAVRTTVATTPFSIAYLSFGYLDDTVKPLSIDGVEANEANVCNGSYPVVRSIHMLTKAEVKGTTKAFLEFVMSTEGQLMIREEGFIPVK